MEGRDYRSAAIMACSDEAKNQLKLLRDIFGNPFRPVTFM